MAKATDANEAATPPAAPADDPAAVRAELDRLRAENAALRDAQARPLPSAPATAAGGVEWEGSLAGDATAPLLRFRHTASEAEAREEYMRQAGMTSTDKGVRVSRVEDAASATAAPTDPPKGTAKKAK